MWKMMVGVVAALGVAAGSAQAQSASECPALWSSFSAAQQTSNARVREFIPDPDVADANGDGTISQGEFLAACAAGQVRGGSAATGTSPGSEGPVGETDPGPARLQPGQDNVPSGVDPRLRKRTAP